MSPAPARTARVRPNLFAIPFSLSGLAGCWLLAAGRGVAPHAVADVLFVVAAVVWVAVLVAYLRSLRPFGPLLRGDLTDRTVGPFLPLAVLTPLLIAAQFLHPIAPTTGRVVVDVLLVLTVLLGAWFTGDWIAGPVTHEQVHPGWFIPAVAGGLIGAIAAAAVGQPGVAVVMFGLGMVCWVLLGSIILARLVVGPMLPVALQPALAIEVGTAAVASSAWFAVNGGRFDLLSAVLAGYGVLMVLVQVRLLPLFVRLPFMPSTWAFAFSWAAAVAVALQWLDLVPSPLGPIARYVLLAAVTVLVGAIAGRTVVALRRGRLVAPAPQAAGDRGSAGIRTPSRP